MQSGVANQSPRLRQALPAARGKWPQFTLEGSSGKQTWGPPDLSGLPTSVPLGLGAEALGQARPAGSSLGKAPPGSTLPAPQKPARKAREPSPRKLRHISKQN